MKMKTKVCDIIRSASCVNYVELFVRDQVKPTTYRVVGWRWAIDIEHHIIVLGLFLYLVPFLSNISRALEQ